MTVVIGQVTPVCIMTVGDTCLYCGSSYMTGDTCLYYDSDYEIGDTYDNLYVF